MKQTKHDLLLHELSFPPSLPHGRLYQALLVADVGVLLVSGRDKPGLLSLSLKRE